MNDTNECRCERVRMCTVVNKSERERSYDYAVGAYLDVGLDVSTRNNTVFSYADVVSNFHWKEYNSTERKGGKKRSRERSMG